MPLGRRRFEGLHIVSHVIDHHPEAFGDLLVLLQGLVVDVFETNNHVQSVPDPEFPGRLSAPFDAAVLIFKLEEEDSRTFDSVDEAMNWVAGGEGKRTDN